MEPFVLKYARLKFIQIPRRVWPTCCLSTYPRSRSGLLIIDSLSKAAGTRSKIHTNFPSTADYYKSANIFIQSLQRGNKISPVSVTQKPCASLCVRNSVLLQGITLRNTQTDSRQDGSSGGTAGISFWKRALFVATVGGLMWYCFWSVNRQKEIGEEKVRYDEFKKADIGGDWVLTDQNGKQRSSTEFRGQWLLLYFGFTHCPDICPEELEKLIRIVKTFDADPKLPNMLPIFISLDPDRDTPAVIRDYLADLKYPRMLGFSGTEAEITEVAKKFRAYFKKGPPDEDNDYIVDHTIIIYLVSPKGEFVNYYDRSRTAERIVASVTEHIDKYNSLEKGSG